MLMQASHAYAADRMSSVFATAGHRGLGPGAERSGGPPAGAGSLPIAKTFNDRNLISILNAR